ncbi:globin [Necator americanus]|uniref:Globin n=1 Tax=Necator americanus TaxID=51031 RepID=W2TPA7_NECAM|nr:globin [Necator americanus]ETN82812.1 globin [Necator americanus]
MFTNYPNLRRYFKGAEAFSADDVEKSERFEKQGQRILLAVHILADTFDDDMTFRAYARETVNKHSQFKMEPELWSTFFTVLVNFLASRGSVSDEQKKAWEQLAKVFNEECQNRFIINRTLIKSKIRPGQYTINNFGNVNKGLSTGTRRSLIWMIRRDSDINGDLRKAHMVFSRRNFGAGSLMTWPGFCGSGKLQLAFPSSRMDSLKFEGVLQSSFLPYLRVRRGPAHVLQQDNAAVHVSTKDWVQRHHIVVIDWPACSPDRNPKENM